MNMTPMRSVRQLFKHLISATKSFGTYGGWGLELLGASLELVQGVRAPSRVLLHFLFLDHSSRRQRVFLAIS